MLAADGKVHLVYELLVTNVSGSVMKLENLEVLNASKGDMVVESESGNAVVGTLQGSAFVASNSPFSGQPSLTVGPYQFTGSSSMCRSPRMRAYLTVLLHRFQFTLDPAAGNPPMASATVVSGRTEVLTHVSPVVIGPPVAGPRWVDAIGCCSPPSVHRTATLPINGQIIVGERFDIDFVELNPEGKLYSGPDNQLSSYAYEGTEVLGRGRHGGQPPGRATPADPGSRHFPPALTLQQGLGNYVVLDIGHGHFAFYAHFQPHTLKGKVGERVHAGQVLARLGNSGNTDAPHLHFGIHDGPSVFSADSLPFVFSSFIVAGTMINSFDHDVQAAGMPAVIGPAAAGSHHNELPLETRDHIPEVVMPPSLEADGRGIVWFPLRPIGSTPAVRGSPGPLAREDAVPSSLKHARGRSCAGWAVVAGVVLVLVTSAAFGGSAQASSHVARFVPGKDADYAAAPCPDPDFQPPGPVPTPNPYAA